MTFNEYMATPSCCREMILDQRARWMFSDLYGITGRR